MISPAVIRDKFSGLVGWVNPTNPAYRIIDETNTASRSGYFVNSNPFIKIDLLKDTQDDPNIDDEYFNTLLADIVKNASVTVLSKVFSEPDFIDRGVLYKRANNRINLETMPTGFVGYKICKSRESNVAVEIKRCLLEFQGTGTIKLLLFNSNKSTPIKSQSVAITSSSQEIVLDWVVDNTSTYYNGELFFGYIANGLTVTPYKRDYNDSSVMTVLEQLSIESIKVNGHITETMFDIEATESDANCWGLNPDISVYYDYTDLAVNNQRLFANAIMLQSQVTVLENYVASIRSNINERHSKDIMNKVIVELDGINVEDGVKKVGLKTMLLGEVQRLRSEIKRLSSNYMVDGLKVITT